MYQLNKKSILSISGELAANFLQTQLTCNINKIQNNEWCFFGYCNRLGKVIASGYLYCINKNRWLIIIDSSLTENIYNRLYKLGLLSNLTIQHENLLYAACNTKANNNNIQLPHSNYYLNITENISKSHDEETNFYHDELNAKIPIITTDSTAKFTPHMLDLTNIKIQNEPALCFDKGCYIGQEYISKVHHKGLNKRIFTTLKFDLSEDIQINQTIYNKEKHAIGQVIQIVQCSYILAGCIISLQRK
jgi:folate-binding protein YgfZ